MMFNDIDILSLIPQRPPFVMVDKLVCCNDKDATTELTVREDNLFVENGELTALGIVENMAQTCAARIGYVNMKRLAAEATAKPAIGVIGDVRNCAISRLPRCQEKLSTQIIIVEEVFNLTLAELITRVGDETIATARLKIALAEGE